MVRRIYRVLVLLSVVVLVSSDAFISKTTAAGGEWWASSDVIFAALNEENPDRWNQRGVAYWSDGDAERVFWGRAMAI